MGVPQVTEIVLLYIDLPAAIGACIARGGPVVLLTGDEFYSQMIFQPPVK